VDPRREKLVAFFLVFGVVGSIGSIIALYMFAAGGVFRGTYTREAVTKRIQDAGTLNLVPLTGFVLFLFLCMVAGSLLYGIYYQKTANRGPRKVVEFARVVGRYGITREGVQISEAWEFEEALLPKYYVRMVTERGRSFEYECPPEVFWACGEGMWGEAELQGRWVGRFTPYIGTPPTA
jgi:hypothetical protein